MEDYYKLLGVDKKADKNTLKKAYRKLAQQYHPDKNQGDESAAEKFKKINEAYTILSDSEKRAEYDFVQSGGGFRNMTGMPGWSQFNGGSFDGGFGSIFEDFFDVPGSPFRRESKRKKKTDTDPTISFNVPLSELKSGEIRKVFTVNADVKCKGCNGKGGDIVKRCDACDGLGKKYTVSRSGGMTVQRVEHCNMCHSRGKIISALCKTCHGSGRVKTKEKYEVLINCNEV